MKNQFYDANDVAKLVYDANDVAACHLNILVPGSWHIFMKHLCGKRWDTDDFDRKSYEIFQVINYFFDNETKRTLFKVSIAPIWKINYSFELTQYIYKLWLTGKDWFYIDKPVIKGAVRTPCPNIKFF